MTARRFVLSMLLAVVAAVAFQFAGTAQAQGPRQVRRDVGLFGNYYVSPNVGIGSRMYPSPRPVPAWVGGSYYTYEGLYPHKFMYSHYDVYWRTQGPKLLNKTQIMYW